jgi:hypothetical protein
VEVVVIIRPAGFAGRQWPALRFRLPDRRRQRIIVTSAQRHRDRRYRASR